jgi:hypothetical protein
MRDVLETTKGSEIGGKIPPVMAGIAIRSAGYAPQFARGVMFTVVLLAVLLTCSGLTAGQILPEQRLPCGGAGYTATYVAGWKDMGPTVNVIFRGRTPTSVAADAALRKCIHAAASTMFITKELVAMAWFGTSEVDEMQVVLADGSSALTYDPATKRVRTLNEEEGSRPTIEQVKGYFVESEEHKVLVEPGGKFVSISVVFPKKPTEKTAYETLISELRKEIDRTHRTVPTDAYACVGSKTDPAGWRQVKGANGKYITAHFDPKSPQRITDVSGDDDLGPSAR